MSQPTKKLKKKQKTKLKKIFLRTILITFVVLGTVAGACAFLYNKFLYKGNGGILSNKEPDPVNKTVAVFGVDEDGYRTDVSFVVNFNSETGKTRIISIPRDTKVEWSNQMQQRMEELKGYSVSVSKLNEMTSYVGIDNINKFTIPEIEELLGIQIDNYVVVTIDAFKKIVDAVGGVDVDVPELNGDGLQYDDNSQDLHIHLSPGMQHLDGEKAEGLVRFRKGYVEGDVGRIKTQQLFLKAFAKKLTSPQIIPKLPSIVNTVSQNVITDIKLSEMPGYIPYLKAERLEKLKCSIIPGEGRYEGSKSYFIPDMEAMPAFIDDVFNGPDESDKKEAVIDKTVSIEVLNSTGITGLAAEEKQKLEAEGYMVSEVGNYTDGILDTTVIYAKDTALATQFLKYYSKAEIKKSKDNIFDIQIVLGNDSVQ